MPQMAPLNWITLMIYFILLFYMFNMLNYFINVYTPLKSKMSKKSTHLNWKW
uniref:ATP synthase F0 subunit 8 n=1 Tax=Oulema tristis TaxID=2824129 RepID=UPI00226D3B78|nr:ATP synthase F0 subunit 8 [Oulema tristis]UZN44091.1 ATP synthase F0 subunit 8 [Oulema tristis]